MAKKKSTKAELYDLLMLLPDSMMALGGQLYFALSGKKRPPLTNITIDDERIYKPVLHAISSMLVFKVLSAQTVVNARVKLLVQIHKGDTAAAARALGSIASTGAVLEFIVGPLLGRLSDRLGRKTVMLAFPLLEMAGNLLVILRPHALSTFWFAQVPCIALGTAFFATMRAMMADVMSGRNIAENGFIHMAPAGLATLVAPLIGARFSAAGCYQFAVCCGAVCALVLTQVQETNYRGGGESEAVVPLTWEACNPLAFVRLFTSGPELRALALVSGAQTYTDPRILEDSAVLVMRDKLRWGDKEVSAQLSTMALSMMMGVPVGKFSIRAIGRVGHTHWSHLAKLLGYAVWSGAGSQSTMRAAQLCLTFGQRQRDGVETLMTDLGQIMGMGRGQLESYKMNWRSVTNLVAPLVYSRVFALGKQRGVLGAPFIIAAFFVAVAELLMLAGIGNKTEEQVIAIVKARIEKAKAHTNTQGASPTAGV